MGDCGRRRRFRRAPGCSSCSACASPSSPSSESFVSSGSKRARAAARRRRGGFLHGLGRQAEVLRALGSGVRSGRQAAPGGASARKVRQAADFCGALCICQAASKKTERRDSVRDSDHDLESTPSRLSGAVSATRGVAGDDIRRRPRPPSGAPPCPLYPRHCGSRAIASSGRDDL